MKKITKTALSLAVASAFAGVANANLTIPQHRTISVDVGAMDKNKNQNIVYNLVITDANGNPVNTGYFIDSDNPNSSFIGVINKTAKQGIVKNIKYKPGSSTPPGEYFVELKATDGTTTLTSPKKSFTITKSEQWIDFLNSNCTSLSTYNGYTISSQNDKFKKTGVNFEAYLLPEFNNLTTLSMNVSGSTVSDSSVICNKNTPVTMPTENNLSNPYLTFSFTGSGFSELNGLKGMVGVKNLIINNTNIANVNSLSGITTGTIDLRNNSLLADVSGIKNLNTGIVYFDPDREFTIKSPFDSPVCSKIITGSVKMLGTRQFQYNICETNPDKLGDLTVVKYLNDYCGKNYLYAEKNFVLNDASAISCANVKGANANFSPVLTTLPVSITFNNSTSGLSGLSNLETVTGSLNVINGKLVNLNDLSKLKSTTNGITVNNSTTLTSLTGLENLSSVGTGTIDIYNNPLLEDVSAIRNIASSAKIRGDDRKEYTFKMPSNSPLCTSLYTKPDNVISTNSVMDFCEAPAGKENASKFLQFFNKNCLKNYKVPNISLFENDTLTTSCNNLNSAITTTSNIPPEATKYSGSLLMSYTKLKDLDLFSNITDITGDLILIDNPDLMNLNGLSKLKSIRELKLGYSNSGFQNTNITNLDSLSSLTSGKVTIQGYLPSYGYPSITSVYGLRNLSTGSISFTSYGHYAKNYMQVKAPANSNLCLNIKSKKVSLLDQTAYYNICEALPEETEIFKTFDYFKNYCNYLIPEPDLNNFSTKNSVYTCNTDLQTESNYSAEGALINWSSGGIQLTGNKTTGVFKKVETIAGYINLSGRSNVTDLSEFGSIKTIGGIYQAYSMPNLTSLNGLQNFTGNLNLNAYYNPLLNDVSALSNIAQGNIYLDNINFGIKNAYDSPFCKAIFTEQVKLNTGMNNWYGNVCELDPAQKDAYDATLWFRDNCNSKSYYSYPNVAAIEGKSSHACTFGQAMNFAPVIKTLKDTTFQSIRSASDFGNSLDNLTTVSNLNLLSASGLGYQNVGFLKNLTTVNGNINLSSNNNLLTDISSLSNLNKVTGTFSLSSTNLDNLTGLDNINYVGHLEALRKDYTTKLPNTSTFCNSLSTIVINRGYATEDNLCQPSSGKEGLFELASKIYDGVYDPVYVSDLNNALGLKSIIVSNSYSKLNTTEGTPVQIGDYFDLSNTNGLNLLTYIKELNFNNSNATKIPNLFNNVTTMDNINIQNESLLNSL
ncbi:MAG: hypothetical protein JHC31_10095, partial [Sulfurihydrogenibium sp.]|nr:hypothetical protein [Sulfurihydrogenibium sp.]